jgi:hypothetical protein
MKVICETPTRYRSTVKMTVTWNLKLNKKFSIVASEINYTFSYMQNLYPPNCTVESVYINFNLRLFSTNEWKEENQHLISFYILNSASIRQAWPEWRILHNIR